MLDDIVDRVLRDELGGGAAAREWLWHRLWELDRTEELPIWLLGLVDTALWDLGRVLGRPVHRQLGQVPRVDTRVRVDGDVRDGRGVPRGHHQCLELGYPAIKLHAWGTRAPTPSCANAVRDHVGDEIPLMYDGSAAFDLPDAVYLGHALGEAGYLWYEEPIREFSVTAYKWLGDRVASPSRRGDLRRRSPQYRRLHRERRRIVRAHKRRAARRDHRGDAHRAPRRCVPAPGGGARKTDLRAPLHGDSEQDVLRVARHVQPGDPRDPRRDRRPRPRPRRTPGIALPDSVHEHRIDAVRSAAIVTLERRQE